MYVLYAVLMNKVLAVWKKDRQIYLLLSNLKYTIQYWRYKITIGAK